MKDLNVVRTLVKYRYVSSKEGISARFGALVCREFRYNLQVGLSRYFKLHVLQVDKKHKLNVHVTGIKSSGKLNWLNFSSEAY